VVFPYLTRGAWVRSPSRPKSLNPLLWTRSAALVINHNMKGLGQSSSALAACACVDHRCERTVQLQKM